MRWSNTSIRDAFWFWKMIPRRSTLWVSDINWKKTWRRWKLVQNRSNQNEFFQLMRRFFLAIICFIMSMGLAHSLPVILNFDEHVIMSIRVYMDYIFHSSVVSRIPSSFNTSRDPLIVVPAAFLTIENYRKFACNKVKRAFGMRTDSHKVDSATEVFFIIPFQVDIQKLRPGMDRETDVYFENFEKQLEEGKDRKKRAVKKPNTVIPWNQQFFGCNWNFSINYCWRTFAYLLITFIKLWRLRGNRQHLQKQQTRKAKVRKCSDRESRWRMHSRLSVISSFRDTV